MDTLYNKLVNWRVYREMIVVAAVENHVRAGQLTHERPGVTRSS